MKPGVAEQRRAAISATKRTPEGRAKSREVNLLYRWTPEAKEKISAWNRARWADPAIRADTAARIRKADEDPEIRQHHVDAAHRRWSDPEIRARTLAAMAASPAMQEYKRNFGAIQRARWQDPMWRKKFIDGMRRVFKTPKVRKILSDARKKVWARPGYKDKMRVHQHAAVAALQRIWDDPELHAKLAAKLADARRVAAARKKGERTISADDAVDAMAAIIIDADGVMTQE